MSCDPKELAADIHRFLAAHAKTSPAYDPNLDGPEDRFTGPDPSMLYAAATALERGDMPADVWSSWGSGCYKPILDESGEAWHAKIIAALRAYKTKIASSGPKP